uniref:Uncharacterized protein n=1 Tax=Anopheles arabiensis TaxID=7173 RepID=A0A499FSS1_ANOAR
MESKRPYKREAEKRNAMEMSEFGTEPTGGWLTGDIGCPEEGQFLCVPVVFSEVPSPGAAMCGAGDDVRSTLLPVCNALSASSQSSVNQCQDKHIPILSPR